MMAALENILENALPWLFGLWALVAVWFAFTNVGPKRIRVLLGRGGWLQKWNMFVPEVAKSSGYFQIRYRDQMSDGSTTDWSDLKLEQNWSPGIALINPEIRLQSYMIQAVLSFSRLHRLNKPIPSSRHYDFFLSIVLDMQHGGATHRQISVFKIREKEKEDLFTTKFLPLS